MHARMRADEVRVVDVAVIEVAAGLHLGLDRLHDFTLAQKLVVDLDAVISSNALVRTSDSYPCVGIVSERTLISMPLNGSAALMNQSISASWPSLLSADCLNSFSIHFCAASMPWAAARLSQKLPPLATANVDNAVTADPDKNSRLLILVPP